MFATVLCHWFCNSSIACVAAQGIISGVGREIQATAGNRIRGVIQTDAAINPGNSVRSHHHLRPRVSLCWRLPIRVYGEYMAQPYISGFGLLMRILTPETPS